ncbi:DNA-processing protein DprA [Cellulomonas cellasea]|uniref:DNA-processing protein DprA n=1 Tax=Cellulomonas cellasea TaxID=43670 RepID=UPI0025A34088|nr:DNA-processing protein DprA [Cellulomonas cellasea]MDM8083553.1 DNA-processing protein DprA [Cellulomonas cellasea]
MTADTGDTGDTAAGDWDAETLARAAWSSLVEPGDHVAGVLVGRYGAGPALRWARLAAARGVAVALAEFEAPGDGGDVEPDGVPGVDSDLEGEASGGPGPLDPGGALQQVRRRLATAVSRWEPRLAELDPRRDLDKLARSGGTLLHPASTGWPSVVDDLGPGAPLCLWVRGEDDLAALARGSAALVGSRASTAYGVRVATDLAEGLAARGVGIVSGGAYGIDAAAHRGALAVDGRTVVLLAGGVDRLYPQGNARLIEAAMASGGAAVSEAPPGAIPLRSRFLQRNRLIAALGSATVVVEAAWRSGALSTAHHAAALLRPLGAVPGPVTSVASAGCHRLLRSGAAVCVTDTAEVLELLTPAGGLATAGGGPEPGPATDARPGDDLDPGARRVLDVLPRRGAASHEDLARRAGLSVAEARSAVGVLALAGQAERTPSGWRLSSPRAGA